MPRPTPHHWTSEVPRNRGMHIVGGSGSGKSTVIGKDIAFFDFLTGKPLVVIDPQGGTIDNFLDKVLQLHPQAFEEVKRSIAYIDMSGRSGYVGRFPLWYRLPSDGLYDVARRFVRAVDRVDPQLRRAPITGYNPFATVASNLGMILYALGLPLSEAPSMLAHPRQWKDLVEGLRYRDPEVGYAVDWYLNDYAAQPPYERNKVTSTFLNKIQPILNDRIAELMFCGSEPTIDWGRVIASRQAVLLDFRYEREPEFKIYWALSTLIEAIQLRGRVRGQPISLIVDELNFLLNLQSGDLLVRDFDDLINRIARNNDVWLTLAHQEMFQVSEQMRDTLLSMGTQVIGYTTKQETAIDYAARFSRFDEYKVKDTRPVYRNDRLGSYLIDQTNVYSTAQEQLIKQSEQFRDLRRFEFIVSVSRGEGSSWGSAQKRTLGADEIRVEDELVGRFKDWLIRRSGTPVTPRPLPVPQVPIYEEEPEQAFEEPQEPAPKPPKKKRVREEAPKIDFSALKPRPRSGKKT